ncbi:MAG: site-specific DNA-methyltransferase, partial [Candidatus Binatia bacterium]
LSYVDKKLETSILENTPTVRLVEHEHVGEPDDRWVNRLILGDSLPVLKILSSDLTIRGHVRLIYIDPPYSTRQIFETRKLWYLPNAADNGGEYAYNDELGGAAYLEFLRKRLILLRELLADDGSIYVHLDSNMAFSVKVIMDEVFGARNFRAWITRQKCSTKNYTRHVYGNISDFIMLYTKSEKYVWHRPYEKWDEKRIRKEYNRIEKATGRRYKLVPIHAQEVRNGSTGRMWRGMMPPPGKHWQYTPEKLDELDRRGEIHWSPTGNPRKKVYFDPASKGVPMQDIWTGFRDAINQNMAMTGYPTEKNLDMLKLIVATSSNEDDIVLDAFVGSGTTCHAAAELNRRWIGIDSSETAIRIAQERLARLTQGQDSSVQGRLDLRDEHESHPKRYYSFVLLRGEVLQKPEQIVEVAEASS